MLHESEYSSRVVDAELDAALRASGAVVLDGAKGVGKTETASHRAKSRVLLDVDQEARRAAEVDPSLVLAGEKPRLIDEWQEVPQLWNHVRRAVDAREGPFILTGSAVPADDATRHTGAGRFSWIRMRPMTLFELGRSTGDVSLGKLLDGEKTSVSAPEIGISELAEITSKGGWPGLMHSSAANAQRVLRGYLDSVARTDIRRVDGVTRDPQKVLSVLRSLARNVATEVSIATIAADAGGADGPVAEATASSYLVALDRLMVLEEQPAWAPRLRSRSRLRSAPKRHFCDPSLAVAALRADPAQLLKDLNYFGFLFESLVVRDLRVYAQRNGGIVLHYRDNVGEVDAIVDAGEHWGAIEVKLGVAHADEAAKNLKKFISRIDVEHRGEPAFLAVVLPTPYGYVREDGVHVIPIQALGP
ncbi:MAG: DUF4143 domain-containing protein [Acidimicrobiales bacterium]|jgi:predicted AAA+ superfamily ATPase